jgi:two-component system response regulator
MMAKRANNLILIVDDGPSDVDLTRRALERQPVPHTVAVAEDGQEALDYLLGADGDESAAAPLPAVVLLDLKLPRIDGLAVLKRLREHPRTRCLPVVVFSTSADERDVRRSYELGANSYLRKPVDFSEFLRAVERFAQYWLAANRTTSPGDL